MIFLLKKTCIRDREGNTSCICESLTVTVVHVRTIDLKIFSDSNGTF